MRTVQLRMDYVVKTKVNMRNFLTAHSYQASARIRSKRE